MREPSFFRLITRTLFRNFSGLSADDREFCVLRDQLWLKYKKNRLLSGYFSDAKIYGQTMRFIRFEDFMRLLDEVFGKKIYAFKTKSHKPVILDLGANIGMSVLFFKKLWPEARILAFEPDPRTFEVLQHNVKTNAWTDVELYNFAISDKAGEIDFYTHPTGDFSLESSALGARVKGAVKHRVKSAVLSSFIKEPLDFVKMDIEGSEGVVMDELAASGFLPNVKAMAIEYHHHLIPEEDKLASFLKIFEDHGFSYQLAAPFYHPDAGKHFQDIMIYVKRK